MDKIDFKAEFKELYRPKAGVFTLVKVPKLNYLMVDGSGDPNTSREYAAAIEALYTLSYTLKFLSKSELGRDYSVPPLEGLWWSRDMKDFEKGKKEEWQWTAMIMVPDWITASIFKSALSTASSRRPEIDFTTVRREALTECLSVQTLFIGPYDEEAPVIAELHNSYLPANNLKENGKHHEIYLSDPRRTVPSKLKTIIRQPVSKK